MDTEDLFAIFDAPAAPALPTAPTSSRKRPLEQVSEESNSTTNSQQKTSSGSGTDQSAVTDVEMAKPELTSAETADNVGPSDAKEAKTDRASCKHDIVYPPGYVAPPPSSTSTSEPERPPARIYPFTLDAFQAHSVQALEKGHSVLVAAHTSAGKTAVAEYAIAMALRDRQRVVYTSPIKALSNQKYRDFCKEFEDVGLMTGDVTISPNASCLVMTTEILRSMLYRGSEILREVAWVVFDEVHYMRDKERGVVWEETLILLPDTVKYVFLSATIPNEKEFAGWVARMHNQVVEVVYTDYRPTPLEHFIHPSGSDGVFLVVDEHSRFRDSNFSKSMEPLYKKDPKAQPQGQRDKNKGDVKKIVRLIREKKYEPAIVFSFSKRECEANALSISKMNLNTPEEGGLVDELFQSAVKALAEEDRSLPQIQHILPLLRQGIGIHHSGLLPILKEIIELLFQEGLIKVLFSTETFSMGLNMPAKTVVFTSLHKFDGVGRRLVSSGEYIQMSGRAGRRGKDTNGIVILIMDEPIDLPTMKNLMSGRPDVLYSAFTLGWNMVLNLLRIEHVSVEHLIAQSFATYQKDQAVPRLAQDLAEAQEKYRAQYDAMKQMGKSEAEIEAGREYLKTCAEAAAMKERVRLCYTDINVVGKFLQPGRLIVRHESAVPKSDATNNNSNSTNGNNNIGMVLYFNTQTNKIDCLWLDGTVSSIAPPQIDSLSALRTHVPNDLKNNDNRRLAAERLREVVSRFDKKQQRGVPMLHPLKDLKIEDASGELKATMERLTAFHAKLEAHVSLDPAFIEGVRTLLTCEGVIATAKANLRASSSLLLKEELKAMKRTLRRLGYIHAEKDTIEVKGRVACEISAADELLITELLFQGFFGNKEPSLIAACLSTLVFDEKLKDEKKEREAWDRALDAENPQLKVALEEMQATAKRVGEVQKEAGMANINVEEYVGALRPQLMHVVHSWCNGKKFLDICHMTDVFEGSVVRCLRRLDEVLRQCAVAARSVGEEVVCHKMEEAGRLLRRDIVFAASLYI
jgi:ATP-dependent RNA helicase DOB1